MRNALNLPEWTVRRTEEELRAYHIHATYDAPAISCPSCLRFGYLRRFGQREQVYLDLPMHGQRVAIHVRRQRYHCTNCSKTMFQPLPDMDEQRHMTRRLVDHIGKEALRRTFVSIADECGVDEKTVRNVFRDYVAHLDATSDFVTPTWLGIDELTLLRQPRCIMTNLREATVVSLLSSRTQATVLRHLTQMPKRESVELVCMDMWAPYREAARAALPQAQIVVDKFHVVRLANQAVETMRKTLRVDLPEKQRRALMHDRFALLKRAHDLTDKDRLTLDLWTAQLPRLARAYHAKESFYGVWDATRRVEAEMRYVDWLTQLPSELELAFAPLITAMGNWHDEIFAYFAVPGAAATNATTEALNGLAKLAQRMGRGYSFEAIRAKILYGITPHKRIPTSLRSKAAVAHLMQRSHPKRRKPETRGQEPRRLILDYGPAISTIRDTLRIEVETPRSTPKSG